MLIVEGIGGWFIAHDENAFTNVNIRDTSVPQENAIFSKSDFILLQYIFEPAGRCRLSQATALYVPWRGGYTRYSSVYLIPTGIQHKNINNFFYLINISSPV